MEHDGPNQHDATETAEEEFALGDLADADLLEEINETEHTIIRIREQLAAPIGARADDAVWRARARAALRHAKADLAVLKAERGRRDHNLQHDTQSARKEAARDNLAAAEARRRAAEAIQAAHRARRSGAAELFLTAANEVLSKEQRAAIWQKVREMFPNDPALAPIPSLKGPHGRSQEDQP